MNILLINGSPRINGNTMKILEIFETILNSTNKEENHYEYVSLSNQKIGICKGCRACFQISEEKCPYCFVKQKNVYHYFHLSDFLFRKVIGK